MSQTCDVTTAMTDWLRSGLAEVQNRLVMELLSDLPAVNDLVAHAERYRGKMLRPMLVLISGLAARQETGGGELDLRPAEATHHVLAAVVEVVHLATLVHDDVLDEAEVRRGGATLNHLRGNEAAVILGDYLISHAYHLCSSLDRPVVSRQIARTTNTVCEGELLQLSNRNNWGLDEPTYFEIIRRKTASLCGTSCLLGAELGGASAETARALHDYGQCLGLAFQIVDDLLDLVGQERVVGKSLGRDLEKGKLTLPVIHLLGSEQAGRSRQQVIGRLQRIGRLMAEHEEFPQEAGHPLATELAELRNRLVQSGSLGYAQEVAQRLVEQAKRCLSRVPGPVRGFMAETAQGVLTRSF